ncbi:hypothetical protein CEUSTIGMA_g13516.t1 [Chlamydomonas eustigma]|uniref:Uncharacterized protein n=1 Tax=Chlamydomonas eustigma TaxID=1157962 RepID=A0A250XSW2_9CHLO|nr:hypothetical protein CEUSTIGMA_g13516.t1 [Chlamydomonas eustigma]|eukprot:GAX86103.1 hypothetical protein CEUSTIGMA_g13516.t1 [Chlamydomonas eustigma]
MTEGGKCKFCKCFWTNGKDHKCSVLGQIVVDTVGVNVVPNPVNRHATEITEITKTLRDLPGIHILLFNAPVCNLNGHTHNVRIRRHDCVFTHTHLVATATDSRMGLGLYTVTGLEPAWDEFSPIAALG